MNVEDERAPLLPIVGPRVPDQIRKEEERLWSARSLDLTTSKGNEEQQEEEEEEEEEMIIGSIIRTQRLSVATRIGLALRGVTRFVERALTARNATVTRLSAESRTITSATTTTPSPLSTSLETRLEEETEAKSKEYSNPNSRRNKHIRNTKKRGKHRH